MNVIALFVAIAGFAFVLVCVQPRPALQDVGCGAGAAGFPDDLAYPVEVGADVRVVGNRVDRSARRCRGSGGSAARAELTCSLSRFFLLCGLTKVAPRAAVPLSRSARVDHGAAVLGLGRP